MAQQMPLQTSRMDDSRRRRWRPPYSVHAHVVGLILVTLLPLLGFSAFLVIRSAEHEQDVLAETVQERALAAARDIEQQLGILRSHLFVIANTNGLSPQHFATLYAQGTATLEPHGLALVVSRPDGQEVVDTRLPFGTPLPRNSDMATIARVVEYSQPQVSDMTISPVTHAPVVFLSVPIMEGGKVAYIASLDVMPALEPILLRQHLPAGWIATLDDRNGYTIARNIDAHEFVGQPGHPAFLRKLLVADQGWFPFPSREGVPLYVAFSRVKPVGWNMVVGIPQNVLYAPVRRSTEVLAMVGGTMLAVALLLALLIGRRIAQPITGLVTYAEKVGRGEPVALRLTGLRETDAVACSLYSASQDLHQSQEARARTAADLATSEQHKQVLHQVVLAQEAERTRIARELHDSLGQYLTALQLGLNALGRSRAADPGAMAELAKLRDLTGRIGGEINRMAWELRPTALDDLGLETAITQHLEEWSERSGLHFDLQVELDGQRLPPTVETTVYRALQEAVTNIVRHAEASSAAIILRIAGSHLQMIVEDDGKGFAMPAGGIPELGDEHLGLLGIRERLALVDGSLEVESRQGGGTTLFVRVPLSGT